MSFSAILLSLASLASLGALIWLITVAFRNGQQNWGIAMIISAFIPLVGPIVALVFIIKFWGIAKNPALLMLGSLCLAGIGFLSLMNNLRTMAQEMADNPDLQLAIQQAQATADSPPAVPDVTPPPIPMPTEPARTAPAEPRAPRRQTPPPRALNASEIDAAAPVPTASAPPPPPAVPDVRISPLSVDFLRLGQANPNQIRSVLARGRNTRDLAIREARLALSYFDSRGLRLGRWMTVHSESTNIVPAVATNEFMLQAFHVPQFTHEVRIEVESIRFANGERWPPIDPVLVQPVPNIP